MESSPDTVLGKSDRHERVVESLRHTTVGADEQVTVPFDQSTRNMVYCDFTASGRSVQCIEDFMSEKVLPTYGNTHSVASTTAKQTTIYREEARDRIRSYFNANEEDSVIFCGAGATGAMGTFLGIFAKSRAFDPKGLEHSSGRRVVRRAVVLVDPVNHHSSILPFREMLGKFPINKGSASAVSNSSFVTSPSKGKADFEIELLTLPLDGTTATASVKGLQKALEEITAFNQRNAGRVEAVPIAILSACSNVTGAALDMPAVSTLVHRHNGIACWDLAAAAAHFTIDMNPVSDPLGYMDFAFLSPHKLLGGPGSSGVLLCKKRHQTNQSPGVCGGGVVSYVSSRGHRYIDDKEEREEAGTPDILGCIRAGAVYHIHSWLDCDRVARDEHRMAQSLVGRITQDSRVHILGPTDRSHCAGIIPFNVMYNVEASGHGLYLHYNFVAALLNDLFGIQARGGCACAGPYGEALLGLNFGSAKLFEEGLRDTLLEIVKPGFVRVGVHFSMTEDELDILAGAILWIAEHGWKLLPSYDFNIKSGAWRHRNEAHALKLKTLAGELTPPWESSWSSASTRSGGTPSLLKPSCTGHGLEELIRMADAVVAEVSWTAQASPAPAAPLIDGSISHLVWFALPVDAVASLQGGVATVDEDAQVFKTEGKQRGRAVQRYTESIFDVRRWAESDGSEVQSAKYVSDPYGKPSFAQMVKHVFKSSFVCYAEDKRSGRRSGGADWATPVTPTNN